MKKRMHKQDGVTLVVSELPPAPVDDGGLGNVPRWPGMWTSARWMVELAEPLANPQITHVILEVFPCTPARQLGFCVRTISSGGGSTGMSVSETREEALETAANMLIGEGDASQVPTIVREMNAWMAEDE